MSLLEKRLISTFVLQQLLEIAKNSDRRLGEVLLEREEVTEEQLAKALANVQNRMYAGSLAPYNRELLKFFNWEQLWEKYLCPILRVGDSIVYAVTVFTPQKLLDEILGSGSKIVFTTKLEVILFLSRVESDTVNLEYSEVFGGLREGRLDWEQAFLSVNNWRYSKDILSYMGLAKSEDTQPVCQPKEIIQLTSLRSREWGA